jgi:4-amino-4-deoxy-L-arabinose transferase-like glycosyltransferase
MLRIASYLLALSLGYGIYFIGKTISKSLGTTTLLLFIITFFTIGSNFNIEEISAAIFTLFASYYFLTYRKHKKSVYLMACGAFVALGIMSKQIAVGIVPAIVIMYLWDLRHQKKNKAQTLINNIMIAAIGVAIIVVPILIYFLTHDALDDFWYWNVTYNLYVYPQQSSAYGLKEGLQYGSWLLAAVVPGTILLFNNTLKRAEKEALALLLLATIFLIPSLLPSFHIYKILAIYPYPLLIWAFAIQYHKQIYMKWLIGIGILLFLFPAKAFYIDFAVSNKMDSSYILEYDEHALEVVSWLQNNTGKNERIVNLGLHYITTLAKRLPHNRYVISCRDSCQSAASCHYR